MRMMMMMMMIRHHRRSNTTSAQRNSLCNMVLSSRIKICMYCWYFQMIDGSASSLEPINGGVHAHMEQ
jgi:hypothetical protein